MPKFVPTGVIVVLVPALVSMGVGVAVADPDVAEPCSFTDSAPVGNIPNMCHSKHTDDGWDLTSSLTEMTINPVPNINASPVSKEAFISGTAKLSITRSEELDCGTPPPPASEKGRLYSELDKCLNLGALELSVQLGCQVDVDTNQQIIQNPTYQSSLSNLNLGNLFNLFTGSNLPTNELGIAPTVTSNPQYQVNLKPFEIKEVSMGAKASPTWDKNESKYINRPRISEMGGGLTRVISVQDFHVEVDGCGGPVFSRLRAKATMKTGHSDGEVSAYSATVQL